MSKPAPPAGAQDKALSRQEDEARVAAGEVEWKDLPNGLFSGMTIISVTIIDPRHKLKD